MHFEKFLSKLTATWKTLEKSFIFIGTNLALVMFRSFPLNSDRNPKNFKEKCSKETLKLNEETKIKRV